MELKTQGWGYRFLIRDTATRRFVEWKDLPDVDSVQEYLRKHRFPKDKLYSEKAFLNDIEKASGYIHLLVEKKETAEYISELCGELI